MQKYVVLSNEDYGELLNKGWKFRPAGLYECQHTNANFIFRQLPNGTKQFMRVLKEGE